MATRLLTILSRTPVTSGVSNYGNWTLYSVEATNEAGEPITGVNLKTFQELPLGQLIEVEVEKSTNSDYPDDCTIKKPKGARYSLDAAPADEAYEELRRRVTVLEQHVGLIPQRTSVTDVPAPPVAAPPAVPDSDEIPFGPSVF